MSVPNHTPRIAVTMGDPGGIGREVIAAALRNPGLRDRASWILLGPWSDAERPAGAELAARSPITGLPYGGARTTWTPGPSIDGGEASMVSGNTIRPPC